MTIAVAPSDEYLTRLREADCEERFALLRDATPDEALAAVQDMGLRELYELPREIVEGWEGDPKVAGTARYVRVRRLLNWRDKPTWQKKQIAKAANVRTDGVGRWRTNYHNRDPLFTNRLPRQDDAVGEIKEPGDDRHHTKNPGGMPLWYPATILAWLLASKRITDDLYPHPTKRGGRKPPGRPPLQRDQPDKDLSQPLADTAEATLQWARERALQLTDIGLVPQAALGFLEDLDRYPDTARVVDTLYLELMGKVAAMTPHDARQWFQNYQPAA